MSVVVFKPRTWREALPMIRAENEEWRAWFLRRKLAEESRKRNQAKRRPARGIEVGRAGARSLVLREKTQ